MFVLLVYVLILLAAFYFVTLAFGETHSPSGAHRHLDPSAQEKNKQLMETAWATEHIPQSHQRSVLSFLGQQCCIIPAEARHITILHQPSEFYEQLKAMVTAAERKVMMSALYIGDGPLSRGLMECIENKAKDMKAQGKAFEVNIILDYNRMHDRQNLKTVQNLLALDYEYDNKNNNKRDTEGRISIKVHLFQNPCEWNRLFTPLGRAKEVLGVQHTKLFVFDERHTILTGANLSDDYFVTRMDRYVVMRENPYLAKWCSRLMDVLVRVSHRVICREEFDMVWSEVSSPLLEEPKGLFQKIVHSVTPVREQAVSSPTHHRRSDCIILPNESKWCPSEQTAQFTQHCAKLLAEFEKEMSTELSGVALAAFTDTAGEKEKTYDTLLFPTVQFARAHLYHDSHVVQHLLRLLTDQDHLFLTSPYLNMYSDFVEEILHNTNSNQNKSCYFDAITASTITNGWQGHKGMAGRIPYFYLQLERSFYYLMKYYHALHRVRVREFSREGFTFHAKGLWVMERGEQKDQDTTQPPYLVAYGSTNYGYRSVHKDVEAEVFLFTVNQTLRDSLRRELQLLLDDSITVEEERFLGLNGKFQPVVSVMAQMGQNFL